jgi:hypothetical protein
MRVYFDACPLMSYYVNQIALIAKDLSISCTILGHADNYCLLILLLIGWTKSVM